MGIEVITSKMMNFTIIHTKLTNLAFSKIDLQPRSQEETYQNSIEIDNICHVPFTNNYDIISVNKIGQKFTTFRERYTMK